MFKPTYRDRQGKVRQTSKWYVEFVDHTDKVRRLPGFEDKDATAELGRTLEKLVMLRVNCETPGRELSRRLEGLTKRMRKRLAAIGLLDGQTATANLSLREHVEDWHQGLLAKGGTADHAKLTRQRVLDVFEGCGFRMWGDVQGAKVEQHLADRRGLPKGRRKRLSAVSNYDHQSVRQFCRWMVPTGRGVPTRQAKPGECRDRCRAAAGDYRRRAASAASAAETGGEQFGVAGPERALVYRLAVESGLRAGEVRSLTRASFRFGAKLATVTVEAKSSKRRRRDELPLRPDTADELNATWLTSTPVRRRSCCPGRTPWPT